MAAIRRTSPKSDRACRFASAMRVHLFVPCFIDQIAPEVAWSTVRILEHIGCEVVVPCDQTCCGQPGFNSGFREEGLDVAHRWLMSFCDAETVVSPSGSCIALLREHYPLLFEDTPCESEAKAISERCFELSEFLVDVMAVDELGARLNARAAYHDGCHGLREIGLGRQARRLLSRVEGLEMVELDRADLCCGFGGSFAVKMPELSVAMADQKLETIQASGVDLLISGESTCLMHLSGRMERRVQSVPVLHLAQVLDPRSVPFSEAHASSSIPSGSSAQ